MMTNLNVSYLGLDLKNPIIAGSSGLTNSIENLKAIEEAGAGAVVLKSIFEEEIYLEFAHEFRKLDLLCICLGPELDHGD